MSHFSVVVVGDDVEGQLAPYHEFECTGVNDEYVQEIDILEEKRAEWESSTMLRLRDPEGDLHAPYSAEFYREPSEEELQLIGPIAGTGWGHGISWTSRDWGDGLGYRTKVRFIPDGWEEVEVPTPEVYSFVDWLENWCELPRLGPDDKPDLEGDHKYGWFRVRPVDAGWDRLKEFDHEVVEVVRRTNPNAKWDWYVIGGRWTGYFLLKHGAEGVVGVGKPGLFTEPAGPGRADVVRKGDVDFATMGAAAGAEAGLFWDKAHAIINGRPFYTWAQLVEKHGDIADVRDAFWNQEVVRDLRQSGDPELGWIFADTIADLALSREDYVKLAEMRAIVPFAYVKDGKWHERGEMGWFGVSTNEMDESEWCRQFMEMIDSLPDDTLLTIVDCHI